MRTLILPLPLAALAAVLLPAFLSAQTVGGIVEQRFRFNGQESIDELGSSAAAAGDVDGDGFADVIVGAPLANPNLHADAGAAYVYSGATGAQLLRLDGPASNDALGSSVAGAGDVDGDGFDDLIVGAPFADPNGNKDSGSAFVFSGATGSLIWRFDGQASHDELGFSVAGAGDVDGDGVPDLIAGVPFRDPNGRTDAGSARVFSGATGLQLLVFRGQAASDNLGRAVAGAGDVDGDGLADLIVAAPFADPGGLKDAGSAFVLSGAGGSLIFQFDGQGAHDEFGFSVAPAGDVDGDGVPDLAAGAPLADSNGKTDSGAAFVFSGATGAQVLRFNGLHGGDALGRSVAGTGDADGDGVPDLAAGAPFAAPGGRSNAGSAFLVSGATGGMVLQIDGQAASDFLGTAVSGAGDADGDGLGDLVLGAPFASPGSLLFAGSAFVFTFNPILIASGGIFSISAGGTIDYAIHFPAKDAGLKYGILLSATGTGPTLLKGLLVPLTKDKFFTASTHGDTPSQGVGFQGILDPQGQALAHFTAAPGGLPARLAGRTLFLAAVNKSLDFSSVVRRLVFQP